jgi:uncharacterized protein GlcG (DUF336 family)
MADRKQTIDYKLSGSDPTPRLLRLGRRASHEFIDQGTPDPSVLPRFGRSCVILGSHGIVPIVVDGEVIGAIGASFDTPEHDVQIA